MNSRSASGEEVEEAIVSLAHSSHKYLVSIYCVLDSRHGHEQNAITALEGYGLRKDTGNYKSGVIAANAKRKYRHYGST